MSNDADHDQFSSRRDKRDFIHTVNNVGEAWKISGNEVQELVDVERLRSKTCQSCSELMAIRAGTLTRVKQQMDLNIQSEVNGPVASIWVFDTCCYPDPVDKVFASEWVNCQLGLYLQTLIQT